MPNWKLLVTLGAIFIIAGILALLKPFPASLAVEQFAAWAFLIIGLIQIFESFKAESWGGKLWTLLLGIVGVFIGLNLLVEPLSGLITLTLLVGAMFIISGIIKIVVGLRVQKSELKAAVVLSGAVSLGLGAMILFDFPSSAQTILGILLGVELIMSGISAIALGLSRKSGGVALAG